METDLTLNNRLIGLTKVNDDSKVKDVYTLLYRHTIWYQAYQNLYPNRGAFTNGIDDDTLNDFDKKRINNIITSLKTKIYHPKPSKQIWIPKANGSKRPISVPSGTDKLIQEACRIILEHIYDSKFSNYSHGFRPNRSCHSALKEVSTWIGTRWFIEFDIKGCFDNINHDLLIALLEERIDDIRFINLIKLFLKAGYIDDWKYNKTISGTPQGGIISPILSNIYLNELDKYSEQICNKINSTPNERVKNKDYVKFKNKYNYLKIKIENTELKIKQIENTISKTFYNLDDNDPIWNIFNQVFDLRDSDKNNITRSIKTAFQPIVDNYNISINKLLEISYYRRLKQSVDSMKDEMKEADSKFRNMKSIDTSTGLNRLHYVRYADDFLYGYIGTKKEANEIFHKIKSYIENELKLEISENKSKITDTSNIKFLGYHISRAKYNGQRITHINDNKVRRHNNRLIFKLDSSTAINIVKRKGYGDYVNNQSMHRSYLINFDDIEIVKQYNAEIRGLYNYYKYASNAKHILYRIQWLAHYSMIKTLGGKHKCSVAQVFKRKIIKTKTENGLKLWYCEAKDKIVEVFNINKMETYDIFKYNNDDKISDNFEIKTINIRSSALKKLMAENCEICGKSSSDVSIVLHHKNKIRNVPNTNPIWTKVQKMRNRKTIAVCHNCHMKIHHP